MNRSLRSAGFQPAVSPTFSRPGVGLRERVQVAGPVGYARPLRVENPRYGRLESLRYRVHGPKARQSVWRRSRPGNLNRMDSACEMPLSNATSEELRRILRTYKTVAVVGLSDRPDRDSHRVAAYLQQHGYRIVPVNPNVATVLGEPAYPGLREVPAPVDVVDIFRKPDAVPEIVEDAIAMGARVIWMQEGIAHNAAADRARAAGLEVVMNKCMLKEHRKLES